MCTIDDESFGFCMHAYMMHILGIPSHDWWEYFCTFQTRSTERAIMNLTSCQFMIWKHYCKSLRLIFFWMYICLKTDMISIINSNDTNVNSQIKCVTVTSIGRTNNPIHESPWFSQSLLKTMQTWSHEKMLEFIFYKWICSSLNKKYYGLCHPISINIIFGMQFVCNNLLTIYYLTWF